MEVCVDSLESSIAAFQGGAARIELCSSLNEGGLTPTIGLYKCIKKHTSQSNFKIFNMIRSRSGDFLYNDKEIECMCEDIKNFVEVDVDGLVFGALDENGLPDEDILNEFCKLIPKHIEKTFHRAFDVCSDWKCSLDTIQRFGFNRVLTSGLEKTAFEGRENIRKFVDYTTHNSLIILPGSGINENNLETILNDTKCKEFHASCRNSRESKMLFKNLNISMGGPSTNVVDEYEIKFTDFNKVQKLAEIYHQILKR